MRGALTPNQSDTFTDKSKPTSLKSVLRISGQCCLMCVLRLLTWLILNFPSTSSMWVHAMDVLLPHPRPRQKEKTAKSEVPAD